MMSGDKASASCPASQRKNEYTTLATTTEKLSELDKETPILSYVHHDILGHVYLNLKVKGRDDGFVYYKIKKTQALKKLMEVYAYVRVLK